MDCILDNWKLNPEDDVHLVLWQFADALAGSTNATGHHLILWRKTNFKHVVDFFVFYQRWPRP